MVLLCRVKSSLTSLSLSLTTPITPPSLTTPISSLTTPPSNPPKPWITLYSPITIPSHLHSITAPPSSHPHLSLLPPFLHCPSLLHHFSLAFVNTIFVHVALANIACVNITVMSTIYVNITSSTIDPANISFINNRFVWKNIKHHL